MKVFSTENYWVISKPKFCENRKNFQRVVNFFLLYQISKKEKFLFLH